MRPFHVIPGNDSLAVCAANLVVETARNAVATKGRFSFVLSGGSTPNQLYSLLAQEPFLNNIPWHQTFVFWGDERCVPPSDSRNNASEAMNLFLRKVPIPARHIFPMPTLGQPEHDAAIYQETIQAYFAGSKPVFDLVLLGLGENGHTASLFPNTPVLLEQEKLVASVFVEEQQMYRITMTVGLINLAQKIVFLVSGGNKHSVLQQVRACKDNLQLPASLIHPLSGDLIWLVDHAAAYGDMAQTKL
ncbi:MAG: 6-phosphogluconolactonase [Bacteroidetes bacterium]|nr:6-phosphogluconolactonase [Bacteroidota bacterium]